MAPPDATCSDPSAWKPLGNDQQDVCQIAQALMAGTCRGTGIRELDLNSTKWYTVSKIPHDSWDCACTHVMYNLLSACAGCQNWEEAGAAISSASWPSIDNYFSGKCTGKSSNVTGAGPPQKRDINWNPPPPHWASNLTASNFDLAQALAVAGGDTEPTGSTDVITSTVTPTDTPIVATTAPTTASVSSGSSSGPNIGAIVGGVIGGLIFLGALIGLLFWLHRRRRRARDVAPSAEFIKPEYYATPPLLSAGQDRRDSEYHDEIEEEAEPGPANRLSWGGGLATTRRQEVEDDGDMLPPFTRGTYIGPSPHEKDHPERRGTGDSDLTMRTNTTTTLLLAGSPVQWSGPSEQFP